jgi:hypothetical protein
VISSSQNLRDFEKMENLKDNLLEAVMKGVTQNKL